MMLDGVRAASMIISLDVWRTRDAALDAILAACRRRPLRATRTRIPHARSTAIEQSLGPAGRDVDLVDPRTGATSRDARHLRRRARARCSR